MIRRAAILLAASLAVAAGLAVPRDGATAGSPADSRTDLDRATAESQLDEVRAEIGQLQKRLAASRTEHREEQDRLRRLDLEIDAANRELRALDQQQRERQRELAELEQQRASYVDSLSENLGQLAEQVRLSYRSGRKSRLRLLLNQDDPALLGRMLAYFDYFNRARAQEISLLKEALAKLEVMQEAIDEQLARIEVLRSEQQNLLNELGGQRQKRQALLAELDQQIGSESSRLQELEQDRMDLEALLERLRDVLADIPADLGSHVGVAQQKGRLPMPLQGPVKHAFGQSRAGGSHWRGWLIGADPGSEVAAIAYGRVAFADWLRGYGLLVILDHGQGFMSLYGYNESLLYEVGTWVEPGAPIAVVGSNRGNEQGLYFELRKNGKAIDPAAWLARRRK